MMYQTNAKKRKELKLRMARALGEKIQITIANTGDMPAVVSNAYSIQAHNGKTVYAPNVLTFMRPLYAGTSIEYTWDQIDDEGHQVDAGTYTIITEQGTVTIEISGPTHFDTAQPKLPGNFVPKPTGHTIRI